MEHIRERIDIYYHGSVPDAHGQSILRAQVARQVLDHFAATDEPQTIELVEDGTGAGIMSGDTRISAYTPSNMDPETLKRIFVQRETLLECIVDRLATSMSTGDKHHILLVGPRGSGKTCMVSLAAWELQKKKELNDVMRIAWLVTRPALTSRNLY